MVFASCFTGIEGTKPIKMSKVEMQEAMPTPEESYLSGVMPVPHTDWELGRPFIITDSKANMLMDARRVSGNNAMLNVGDTLRYVDSRSVTAPDGRLYPAVSFDRNGDIFEYTSRSRNSSSAVVSSDEIPGLLDVMMLDEVSAKLKGNRYWTLSKLWDDSTGNRMEGKKFIPVTIVEVEPGSMVFPYKITFLTDDGKKGYYMMKAGKNSDSHTFSSMFAFTDPRKRYPTIEDDVWDVICNGEVKPGMTKDEVRISRGLPTEVRTGHDYSRALLIWGYPDGLSLYFEDGILTGINKMDYK